MKVSEAFLVNTKNFESIIQTLVKYDAEKPIINSALLEDLCFSDPNDLLVVRILKDFNVIDNDGKPSTYFDEFNNPKTTKIALGKGLISAYEGLFKKYPKIHQASIEKVKEAFEDIFEGKKTDLIIKYISGTFYMIVSYVGVPTIDAILENNPGEGELEATIIEAEPIKSSNNGVHTTADDLRKESSNKNIDDLVNDFDSKISQGESLSDKDTDLTVREFIKDDFDDEEIENDPFDFQSIEDASEEPEAKTTNDKIDIDPLDLDLSLTTATQTNNSMEHLTAEHEFVQKALLRKADLLQKMNRWEDLIPTLEEIIKRYDNEEYPGLSEAVSRSIIRRATALLKLNKTDQALPALNAIINRFQDSENKEFFDQASRAMLYKANLLEKNGSGNLLPLYNMIIDRLDSTSELQIKEKLDEIHIKRFDLIVNEGENSGILSACTKLIKRFKDQDEHAKYLQKAMIIRAEMLDKLGRDEEALAAYDQFLAAFGN